MGIQVDLLAARNQAIYYAMESHPNRYNIEKKPTVEDILERAAKFEEFLTK